MPLAYTSLARSFMMSPNDSGINELAHIKKSASVSGVQLSSEKKNNKSGKNDSIKKKAACPAYAEIELSEKLVTKSKAVTMISHLLLYFLALFFFDVRFFTITTYGLTFLRFDSQRFTFFCVYFFQPLYYVFHYLNPVYFALSSAFFWNFSSNTIKRS